MTEASVARPQPAATPRGRPMGPLVRRAAHAAIVYLLLLALTAFILLPLGWMITAALKPDTAPVFTFPPEWLPTRYFNWGTFGEALLDPDEPYGRFAINTALLVAVNIVGAVLSNSFIAYPFARLRFRGRNVLFAIVIGTMLLPAPVLLVPQFLLFFNIGWYGTDPFSGFPMGYLPLTVPSFTGSAFFIFLLRQYMRTIPRELDEAARIDGAGYWTIYWRIIMPLTAPALVVVAVFTFLGTWNDFFGPLLYLDDPQWFTVALGLQTQLTRVGTEWNILMAGNLVAIVPPLIVYALAQKRLIGGIASVGIRG
ncbi:MAG: carbohydrate ABC transporter permease [Chloroflexota bacterium]|nr:carbohydrate ABC transporter permease [Chloroflexota bacterium]